MKNHIHVNETLKSIQAHFFNDQELIEMAQLFYNNLSISILLLLIISKSLKVLTDEVNLYSKNYNVEKLSFLG